MRLTGWLGELEGDLRQGGQFQARFFVTGWEGTARVRECQPPQHFLIMTTEDAGHFEDLARHLVAGERCDAQARWAELLPAYQGLAVTVGE